MKGRKEGRTKITRHADGRYRPIDMNYGIRRRRPRKQHAEIENMIESAENGHRDVHLRGVLQWNGMCNPCDSERKGWGENGWERGKLRRVGQQEAKGSRPSIALTNNATG